MALRQPPHPPNSHHANHRQFERHDQRHRHRPDFSQSAVGTAALRHHSARLPTPTFTPAPGSYASAQNVTINDATAGATIYYTTNGSTPTTASTVYAGPIAVSVNTTINAIATAPNFSQSAVASGFYSIGSTPAINLSGGFSSGVSACAKRQRGSSRQHRSALPTAPTGQAGAGWYGQPINITSFTTDFSFQINARHCHSV